MISGLVVARRHEVGRGELEPDARQIGAAREDCFEPPRGLARKAELHLDAPEHEETLDGLVLSVRTGLFEERAGVPQPAGLNEKPAELQVGQLRGRSLPVRLGARAGQQERRRNGCEQSPQGNGPHP